MTHKPHKIGIGWAHSGEGETGKVIPGLGISEHDFGKKLVIELGREIFNAGMVSALDHGRIALGDLITDLKQLTEKKHGDNTGAGMP